MQSRIWIFLLGWYVIPSALALQVETENAHWEIFANRLQVYALAAAPDGESMWVGTGGGLEQRDPWSGEVLQVFTVLDGLPGNAISALAWDTEGGMWIGTRGSGLAYLDPDENLRAYREDSSPLSSDMVLALLSDAAGGMWIGTAYGLTWSGPANQWRDYTPDNAPLPDGVVTALADDGAEGLWIGTYGGLVHWDGEESWQVFNRDNTPLNNQKVAALLREPDGGLWIGIEAGWENDKTLPGGLAYRTPDGSWQLFTTDNSDLPADDVSALWRDAETGVLWIGTQEGGLARLNEDASWHRFNTENAGFPGNSVSALIQNPDGRLWIGFNGWDGDGLRVRESDYDWYDVNEDEMDLPDNGVSALTADADGNLWIGGGKGVTRFGNDGTITVFTNAEGVPDNDVLALATDSNGIPWVGSGTHEPAMYSAQRKLWLPESVPGYSPESAKITALAADEAGGLWLGLFEAENLLGRLVYRAGDGNYQEMPLTSGQFAYIDALVAGTGAGEVWVGTNSAGEESLRGGLFHRGADGTWRVERSDNSNLPDDEIRALALDANGGLWVGTEKALAYRSGAGQWQRFPYSGITVLRLDEDNGLWVGTEENGVYYRDAEENWTRFDTADGLPTSHVTALHIGVGEIWIGTAHGLGLLGFGEKEALAQLVEDEAERATLLQGKRAALLIHPRGQRTGYNQDLALDFMASYAYHTLLARGYDNDEIYFLSYQPDLDINGDDYTDSGAVDAPVNLAQLRQGAVPRDLTLRDVEQAFAWAVEQGELNQPLVVIFVGDGIPGGLLLDPAGQEILDAATFKKILDDYQAVTDNLVVTVVEACHSGTLLDTLAAPQRLVSSSTDTGLSYYNDLGRTSFLKFYLDQLRDGSNFTQAVQSVDAILHDYRWPFTAQNPQSRDQTPRPLCLNGCWGSLPGKLTLTVETPADTVEPGASVELKVQANVLNTSVRTVWASVVTPRIAAQRNEQGFSRQPAPAVNLRQDRSGLWQGNFTEFSEQGDYLFTVKARDHQGFVTEATPFNVRATGGASVQEASFDPTTSMLHLPAVTLPVADELSFYQADLQLTGLEPPLLEVRELTPLTAEQAQLRGYVNFNPHSGGLILPSFEFGGQRYRADLYLHGMESLSFRVDLNSLRPVGP